MLETVRKYQTCPGRWKNNRSCWPGMENIKNNKLKNTCTWHSITTTRLQDPSPYDSMKKQQTPDQFAQTRISNLQQKVTRGEPDEEIPFQVPQQSWFKTWPETKLYYLTCKDSGQDQYAFSTWRALKREWVGTTPLSIQTTSIFYLAIVFQSKTPPNLSEMKNPNSLSKISPLKRSNQFRTTNTT